MMQFGIDLYSGDDGVRQGLQFDYGRVLTRLFETFPQIEFEEEYYKSQISAMERLIAEKGAAAAGRSARRDAEQLGPGFSFRITAPDGSLMRGGITRYRLTFRFDGNIDPELKAKAEMLLASISISRFETDLSKD